MLQQTTLTLTLEVKLKPAVRCVHVQLYDGVYLDKNGRPRTNIGCSISSLASYLTDRFQRVVQPPVVTEWKPVTRGVPQGGGLSSHFFNRLPTSKIYRKTFQSYSMQSRD